MKGRSYLLKACLFATGCAGIVAEFVLSTLASYLLGNTTLQWTLVMSLMLFTMGLGSRLSRHIQDRLLDRFIAVEFTLSVLCASCGAAAYFGTALVGQVGVVLYGYAAGIGLLIGLEIPLVARMNETYESLRTNIASVMEKDYYGALVGGLLFAFFALPHLGLTFTPIMLGAVNFTVASALLWQYRGLLVRRRWLTGAFWTIGIGLVGLGVSIRPIMLFGEQSRYRDRVIYEAQTPYQRIVMTEWKGYHWLFLNGSVQFSTYDEERYHEPLTHPAMGLAASRERVLILGGGDGLAAREALKHADVRSITLVDLDPAMTELARTHPALLEANGGALNDPRLRVVNRDAGRFLEDVDELFDVILIDLPDPKGPGPGPALFQGVLPLLQASPVPGRGGGDAEFQPAVRDAGFSVCVQDATGGRLFGVALPQHDSNDGRLGVDVRDEGGGGFCGGAEGAGDGTRFLGG